MKNDQTVKMRRSFVTILQAQMSKNKDIWIVTSDLGYKMWDDIRKEYPGRFINVGAAEQVMVGIGIGLALERKIPFVYSITPFLLYRPFETIRNYIHKEKIPVKLIGSGRNQDYIHDGFSHWAEEDKQVMGIFSNIVSRWPRTNEDLPALLEEMITRDVPYYVNLRK